MSRNYFEQTDGLAQFPPDALEIREVQTSDEDAERVIERFGDPDRLVSVRVSLVEHAAFGEGARSSAISSAISRSDLLSADLADHIAPQRRAQSPSGHAVRALYARARRETFSSRRSRDLSLRYSAAPSL